MTVAADSHAPVDTTDIDSMPRKMSFASLLKGSKPPTTGSDATDASLKKQVDGEEEIGASATSEPRSDGVEKMGRSSSDGQEDSVSVEDKAPSVSSSSASNVWAARQEAMQTNGSVASDETRRNKKSTRSKVDLEDEHAWPTLDSAASPVRPTTPVLTDEMASLSVKDGSVAEDKSPRKASGKKGWVPLPIELAPLTASRSPKKSASSSSSHSSAGLSIPTPAPSPATNKSTMDGSPQRSPSGSRHHHRRQKYSNNNGSNSGEHSAQNGERRSGYRRGNGRNNGNRQRFNQHHSNNQHNSNHQNPMLSQQMPQQQQQQIISSDAYSQQQGYYAQQPYPFMMPQQQEQQQEVQNQATNAPPSANFYSTMPYDGANAPNQELEMLKYYLVAQIEYYFSVENLCRDVYFRSQMNQEGFVPLAIIAAFNRIKALTTDISVIKDALLNSVLLECRDDSVRLRESWQTWVMPSSSPLLATTAPYQPADTSIEESQMNQSSVAVEDAPGH